MSTPHKPGAALTQQEYSVLLEIHDRVEGDFKDTQYIDAVCGEHITDNLKGLGYIKVIQTDRTHEYEVTDRGLSYIAGYCEGARHSSHRLRTRTELKGPVNPKLRAELEELAEPRPSHSLGDRLDIIISLLESIIHELKD